jgi:hypothetical protein
MASTSNGTRRPVKAVVKLGLPLVFAATPHKIRHGKMEQSSNRDAAILVSGVDGLYVPG